MSQFKEEKEEIQYYLRENLYNSAERKCDEILKKRANDSYFLFWKCVAQGLGGRISSAIRELDHLRQRKRDQEYPCMMALKYFHEKSAMPDVQEIDMLEATLPTAADVANDQAKVQAALMCFHMESYDKATELLANLVSEEGGNPRTPIQMVAYVIQAWVDMSVPIFSRDDVNRRKKALRFLQGDSLQRDMSAIMARAKFFEIFQKYHRSLDELNTAIALKQWFLPALLAKSHIYVVQNDWAQCLDTLERVLEQDGKNVSALRLKLLYLLAHSTNNNDDDDNDDEDEEENITFNSHLSTNRNRKGFGSSSSSSSSSGKKNKKIRLLDDLISSLEIQEPGNSEFYYNTSCVISRICGRNKKIIEKTISILESARNSNRGRADIVTEIGTQYRFIGNYSMAMNYFQESLNVEQGYINALIGMSHTQILQGDLQDAEQQIEFFQVIQNGANDNPKILFLQSLLEWRKHHDQNEHVNLLSRTIESHIHQVRESQPKSIFDKYIIMDPDFLVEIGSEFLLHLDNYRPQIQSNPSSSFDLNNNNNNYNDNNNDDNNNENNDDNNIPSSEIIPVAEDKIPIFVLRGLEILTKAISYVPTYLKAHLMMARTRMILGHLEKATDSIIKCHSINPSYPDAYLLHTQIDLLNKKFRRAENHLDQAVSYNFSIRTSPLYLLLKAKLLRNQNLPDEAVKLLEEAFKLPGVKDITNNNNNNASTTLASGSSSSSSNVLTLTDRASIFIEYVELLSILNRLTEANNIILEAKNLFRDTSEEVRILIAHSNLSLQRNDIEKAISMLSTVPKDSPIYSEAQTVKADIYLNKKRDRTAYIQCYQSICDDDPKNVDSYIKLGDAFMNIQSPESAVRAYERALDITKIDDPVLAVKIGRALISTHDYRQAIDYYESSLRNSPNNLLLRHDLAKLYHKLERFDASIRILSQALHNTSKNTNTLIDDVKTLLMMVNVYLDKKNEMIDEAEEALNRARDLQREVIELARSEGHDFVKEQKIIMANILYQTGQLYELTKDLDAAIEQYEESLQAEESFESSLLALSTILFKKDKLNECEDICMKLRRVNPKNEKGMVMFADLKFKRGEYDLATNLYQELLEKKPNHYKSLSQLINLFRRAGRLEDVPVYLRMAERNDPRSISHSGLNYCKGIYYHYIGDIHKSIEYLNQARGDLEWGAEALEKMIEIYLNPSGTVRWEEEDDDIDITSDQRDSLQVAERLVHELLEEYPVTPKRRCLESYVLIGTRKRNDIDIAMENFLSILEEEPEFPPALFGMAMSFMLEHSQQKSRNFLKRIAKMPYDQTYGDDLEKGYILLASFYMKKGKDDMGMDLCRRAISYNKSSSKGWETLGWIYENNNAYESAADCYEKAWKIEHETSASIGYKLAFNYIKASKWVEAIQVATKVLEQYPEYPKMESEILEEAQRAIRP